MKLLTLIVPAFNEENNLPALRARLNPVLDTLKEIQVETEIILLDNCSTDGTAVFGRRVCQEDKRWRYVRYSRNFGYHGSLACGFDLAQGDALIVLASDLQEPPELIPKMVSLWQAGNDVAYGVLKKRRDHLWLKTLGAKVFYRVFSYLSDFEIPPYATDFRILSRRVVDAVNQMRESDRYLRGLVHWSGFRQVPFEYDRDKRVVGESAGIWPSTIWAVNATLCFSQKPLRALSTFGFIVMLASMLSSIYFFVIYFFPPRFIPIPPTGTTVLALLLLFGIGANAFSLGIVGEYVGRIYNQAKLRPLYIIDETVNIEPREKIGRALPQAKA
jgi:glycosyltransferase involved in cell wall biosynthesis